MSDIKDVLDQWEFDHATECRPGGLLPTTEATNAMAREVEPMWGKGSPIISSLWEGDIRVTWKATDRGCSVIAARDGTVSCTSHIIAIGRRHDAPVDLELIAETVDWVLATRPTEAPAVKTVKGYGPLVLDAVVDKVLPWWARPIVKGPVLGGIRFVAKQVSKIDPATIDRAGNAIKGRVEACRNYWRSLDAKP